MGFLDDMPHRLYCAWCGHAVEQLDERHDERLGARIVTASCHGDREVSVVRDDELRGALPGSFRYALAFTHEAYRDWRVFRGTAAVDLPAAVDVRDSAFNAPFTPRPYAPFGVGRYPAPVLHYPIAHEERATLK
jgi:hypothetical protein